MGGIIVYLVYYSISQLFKQSLVNIQIDVFMTCLHFFPLILNSQSDEAMLNNKNKEILLGRISKIKAQKVYRDEWSNYFLFLISLGLQGKETLR